MTIANRAGVLSGRVIEPSDFVADQSAFIDVRLPRSRGKASYSFIGPGVTQNKDAFVNLVEPHGFCVGAASMQAGVVNNPHLHYTAEVFMCLSGEWRMDIGVPVEHSVVIHPGDVFSVPTWVFRSFENIGNDEGYLYTVLGGDDPGGIVWAPSILRAARATGLALNADHEVVEVGDGDNWDGLIAPISDDLLARIPHIDATDVIARVVHRDGRAWRRDALLSAVGRVDGVEFANVIGCGVAENRDVDPPIHYPHGFSLQWLRAASGSDTGVHSCDETSVVVLVEGSWAIDVEGPGGWDDATCPREGSIVSIPRGVRRNFRNVGTGSAEMILVVGADWARLTWDSKVVAAARERGFVIDANGFIGDKDLVDINTR